MTTLQELTYQIDANTAGLNAAVSSIQGLVTSLLKLDQTVTQMATNYQSQIQRVAAASAAQGTAAQRSAQAQATALARQANAIAAANEQMTALNRNLARAGAPAALVNQTAQAFATLSAALNTVGVKSTEIRAAQLAYASSLNTVKAALQDFNTNLREQDAASRVAQSALLKQENAVERMRVKYLDLLHALNASKASPERQQFLTQGFDEFEARMKSGVLSSNAFSQAQNNLTGKMSEVKRTSNITNPAIKALVDKINDLTSSVQFALGPLSGIASRISAFSTLAHKGGLATAGLIAGIIGFGTSMGLAIREGAQLENQLKAIQAELDATGNAANLSADDIDVIAKRISHVTLATDDAVREASLSFLGITGITKELAEQALLASQGLSLIARGDIVTNSRRLTKVLEDPMNNLNGLSEAGIKFNAVQELTIRKLQLSGDLFGAQQVVIDRLKPVMEAARGQASGLSGAWAKLGKDFRDMAEDSANSGGALSIFTKVLNDLDANLLRANNDFEITAKAGRAYAGAAKAIGQAFNFVINNLDLFGKAIAALLALGFVNWVVRLGASFIALSDKIYLAVAALGTLEFTARGVFRVLAPLAAIAIFVGWDKIIELTEIAMKKLGLSSSKVAGNLLDFLDIAKKAKAELADFSFKVNVGDTDPVKIVEDQIKQLEDLIQKDQEKKKGVLFGSSIIQGRIDVNSKAVDELRSKLEHLQHFNIAPQVDAESVSKAELALNDFAKAANVAADNGKKIDLSSFAEMTDEFGKTHNIDVFLDKMHKLTDLTQIFGQVDIVNQLDKLSEKLGSKEFRISFGIDDSAAERLRKEIGAIVGEDVRLNVTVGGHFDFGKIKASLADALKTNDFTPLFGLFDSLGVKLLGTSKEFAEMTPQVRDNLNEFAKWRDELIPAIKTQDDAEFHGKSFTETLAGMKAALAAAPPELQFLRKELEPVIMAFERFGDPIKRMTSEMEDQIDVAKEQGRVLTQSALDQAVALAALHKQQELVNQGYDSTTVTKQVALAKELETTNQVNQFKQQTKDLAANVNQLALEVQYSHLADADRESIVGRLQDQLTVQLELGDADEKAKAARLALLEAQRQLTREVQNEAQIRGLHDQIQLQLTSLQTMFLSEGTRKREIELQQELIDLNNRYGTGVSEIADRNKALELSLFKQKQANEVLLEQVQVLADAYNSIFDSLQSSIENFVKTGKFSIQDLADEITSNVFSITLKASIIDPLKDTIGHALNDLFPGTDFLKGLTPLGSSIANPMYVKLVDSVLNPTGTPGDTSGGLFGGIIDWFKGLFTSFTGGSTNTAALPGVSRNPFDFVPTKSLNFDLFPQLGLSRNPYDISNVASPALAKAMPFGDLVAKYEGTINQPSGGYNTSLGYGKFLPGGQEMNISDMTFQQIKDLQTSMLNNPANTYNSSALGKFEFTRTALFGNRQNPSGLVDQTGLSMADKFSPENQDFLFEAMAQKIGPNVEKLQSTWTGLLKAGTQEITDTFQQEFKPVVSAAIQPLGDFSNYMTGPSSYDPNLTSTPFRDRLATVQEPSTNVLDTSTVSGAFQHMIETQTNLLVGGIKDALGYGTNTAPQQLMQGLKGDFLGLPEQITAGVKSDFAGLSNTVAVDLKGNLGDLTSGLKTDFGTLFDSLPTSNLKADFGDLSNLLASNTGMKGDLGTLFSNLSTSGLKSDFGDFSSLVSSNIGAKGDLGMLPSDQLAGLRGNFGDFPPLTALFPGSIDPWTMELAKNPGFSGFQMGSQYGGVDNSLGSLGGIDDILGPLTASATAGAGATAALAKNAANAAGGLDNFGSSLQSSISDITKLVPLGGSQQAPTLPATPAPAGAPATGFQGLLGGGVFSALSSILGIGTFIFGIINALMSHDDGTEDNNYQDKINLALQKGRFGIQNQLPGPFPDNIVDTSGFRNQPQKTSANTLDAMTALMHPQSEINLHAAVLSGAIPRYHEGLMPDEFLGVFQQGEGILNKNQVKAISQVMGSGGDSGHTNHFTVNIVTPNPESFRNSRGQIETLLARAVNRGASRGS